MRRKPLANDLINPGPDSLTIASLTKDHIPESGITNLKCSVFPQIDQEWTKSCRPF